MDLTLRLKNMHDFRLCHGEFLAVFTVVSIPEKRDKIDLTY